MNEQDYTNYDLCAECGGKCCLNMPGIFAPEQLGAPDAEKVEENMRKLLQTGGYAIDCWEGDPRDCDDDFDEKNAVSVAYYLRPATVDKRGQLTDWSWGGECCLNNKKMRSIIFKKRNYIIIIYCVVIFVYH